MTTKTSAADIEKLQAEQAEMAKQLAETRAQLADVAQTRRAEANGGRDNFKIETRGQYLQRTEGTSKKAEAKE